MPILSYIIVSAVAALLLEAATALAWNANWARRDILYGSSNQWRAARILTAVLVGTVFAYGVESPLAAGAAGAAGWLAVLASDTDIRCMRIPREPCWSVFFVIVVFGLLDFNWASLVSLAVAVLIVGGSFFAVAVFTKGALGSGDVRLVVALSALSWWVGFTPLFVGVIVAGVLQLFARLVARRRFARPFPYGPALAAGLLLSVLYASFTLSACSEIGTLVPC